MDYIAAISGSIIGAIIFILRDIQKSKKRKNFISAYAAQIFLKTKGKQL